MGLSEMLASDRVTIFSTSDLGTAATYRAPDGTATAITLHPFGERTEDTQQRQSGIWTRKRMRGAAINRSEVATVNQKATITIGATEYAINQITYEDAAITVVELARHELTEHTRPGYRIE